MDELGELLAWLLWGWWLDGSGNSGRTWGMGKKGTARGKRPARPRDGAAGRVIYCGGCGTTGEHLTVRAVRVCYGRAVIEGPDYGYVSGRIKPV
jgi:hypothetical protein